MSGPKGDLAGIRVVRMLVAVALALAWTCSAAQAGSTNPVLVIGQADASGGATAELVELTGAWGFDDILQVNFPLGIVVSQGPVFVRFSPGQAPTSGTFAGLVDGLTTGEIGALEAAGSADSQASLLHLGEHQMTLQLPPVFGPGDVDVVLYVVLPLEGSFLSNVAAAPLHGGGL